jgi:nitrate reductase NapAB chaperone NapD
VTERVLTPLTKLIHNVEAFSAEVTARIRREVPGYAVVRSVEHQCDVEKQINNALSGLQAQLPPSTDAIHHARSVGRQRARQQLSLLEVIEAYHIAYRDIWNELVTLAGGRTEQALALVDDVGLLWNWFHRLSAAVAEGYSAESNLLATNLVLMKRDFLAALTGASAVGDRDTLAQSLGFVPSDEFQVACLFEFAPDRVQALTADIEALDTARVFADESRLVVVLQRCSAETLLATVGSEARIGVGIIRAGFAGAVRSLADAELAVLRARNTARNSSFGDDWLFSIMEFVTERLEPLLAQGAWVAVHNTRIAETVETFAANRFSLSACARALRVHPNTIRYRLDRWDALTGWDVYTPDGLIASLRCLDLARRGP